MRSANSSPSSFVQSVAIHVKNDKEKEQGTHLSRSNHSFGVVGERDVQGDEISFRQQQSQRAFALQWMRKDKTNPQ